MRRIFAAGISLGLLFAMGSSRAEGDAPAPHAAAPAAATWCAPELESLADEVCYAPLPPGATRRTLVVFLHGVIEPASNWQHNQQRGIVRSAKRLGFAVLAPRGRVGISSGSMRDWITWPTSAAAQQKVEDDVLREWTDARAEIERRDGAPFDEVFVVGFSNGAYYASSLALRGRLDVDGYAVFAGGSAPDHLAKQCAKTERRVPVFAGIAAKDSTSKDTRGLARVLGQVGWPHKSEARNVGHAISDKHLDHALAYLRGRVDAR